MKTTGFDYSIINKVSSWRGRSSALSIGLTGKRYKCRFTCHRGFLAPLLFFMFDVARIMIEVFQ
jgi:hypothetical protein